ncbi:MAG: hypothetical protein JWN11_29 [Hyphomicrobiales bacterium]|nr:hypothetical protein [Hyphomicrobiales bacterium]
MPLAHSLPTEFNRGVVTMVHQGDCHVSADPDLTYSTVLGSCISACVYDRVAGVGGMNHFLLAEQSGSALGKYGASARYGAFAMEQLLNMVLSRGTRSKTNLEIKVFGGGLVTSMLQDIGAKNIAFVRDFLANEGYALAGEDVGGTYARRVLFKPGSGRAFVRRLGNTEGASVANEEIALVSRRTTVAPVDDIELF